MSDYVRLSKHLCRILRWQPELIDIQLDEYGNANVDELIQKINLEGKHKINKEILEQIVREDEKGRYAYNENHTKIRCVQGHGIDIKGTLVDAIPPDILYHGTSTKVLNSIMAEGLKPMKRNYVHLSIDLQTARKVGIRHGKPVILKVNCKQMVEDGYQFKIAENGVYQIKEVPPQYIQILNVCE